MERRLTAILAAEAARLESATKELRTPVAVSRDTLETAGLSADRPFHNITLRGRSKQIAVAAFNTTTLGELLATAPIS
jgi:hypothetical protein